jgi:hypothetical protein
MIKFFRKIRQKKLTENKFSKYLIYAIGEIILVVIGILIAVKINNLNESSKLRDKEKQIYVEIKNDLIQTKNDINITATKHRKIAKSTQQLLFDIENKVDYSLDIYLSFISSNWDTKIIPKTSAFENLKSTGLNILSNDSIRINLTNLYQLELKRFDDELGLNNAGDNIKKALFPYQTKYIYPDVNNSVTFSFKHADSIIVPGLKIKDYEAFIEDDELIEALLLSLYNRSRKIDLENETIIKIDNTIKEIDRELEKLEK